MTNTKTNERKPRGPIELSLARTAGHGGRRAGAGRKKKETQRVRGDVPHVARPKLRAKTPVHVTARLRAGRPSLRAPLIREMFAAIIRETDCDDFHVAKFSLQHDHVHMINEARDKDALAAGMRRVMILFSLRLNQLFGRTSGKNWSGRYHRRDLTTPRQVRNALVYVLMNGKKHGEAAPQASWLDPVSSAAEFDGWQDVIASPRATCGPPRFWLLRVGWKRHGLLLTTESPAPRASAARHAS